MAHPLDVVAATRARARYLFPVVSRRTHRRHADMFASRLVDSVNADAA
jgi:hypothetical protein